MNVASIPRVVAVLAACLAAVGSATSRSEQQQPNVSGPGDQASPPPPQDMDATRALGLWRSTFGAVKIEADNSQGGIGAGNLQGIWVYERQGQEVVGYFSGNLRGNVLQFRWQEPSSPPLTGEGYLVFDVQGRQYAGRWWSDRRDRIGDWRGWRQSGARQAGMDPNQYGETPVQPSPYRRPQPYQRQPNQPRPSYPPQPYQQPYQPALPSPSDEDPDEPQQSAPYQQPSPYQQPQQRSPYQQPQQPAPKPAQYY